MCDSYEARLMELLESTYITIGPACSRKLSELASSTG